jgi:hypothetical protein
MTAPTLELLPCPFCAEQPELYPHDDQVACETEKCPIRRTRISIAAWNTRAQSLALVDAGQGWQDIETAPEDEWVLLSTMGEWVGQALMLLDDDGKQKWAWAGGQSVATNHIPIAWQPMPLPVAPGEKA